MALRLDQHRLNQHTVLGTALELSKVKTFRRDQGAFRGMKWVSGQLPGEWPSG